MIRIIFKKGDTVKVLSGKDRGKTGKIVSVDRLAGRVTVEGVNLHTRHERPKRQGQKGQKVQLPSPMNPSKLMLVCGNCGKQTRIGFEIDQQGGKYRVCKKCKTRV